MINGHGNQVGIPGQAGRMVTYRSIIPGFLLPGKPVMTIPCQVNGLIPMFDESVVPHSDSSNPHVPEGKLNGPYLESTIRTSGSLETDLLYCGHRWINGTSPYHILALAAPLLSSDAVKLTPKEHTNKGRNKRDLLDPEKQQARGTNDTTLDTQACLARRMTSLTSIPPADKDLKRSEMT